MRDGSREKIDSTDILKASPTSGLRLPFFSSLVSAGFASPASDHIEQVCSLDELCDTRLETTYFVRCGGDSMSDDGLWNGDIMIVDRRVRSSYEGQIVVAWINGDLIVKRYHKAGELIVLMPANPAYMPIYVQPGEPGDAFKLFGVVTFWLKKAQFKHLD